MWNSFLHLILSVFVLLRRLHWALFRIINELMAKPLNDLPLRRIAQLQQWQGSCLGGLQSTLMEEKLDIDRGGPTIDPDLWYLCQGRDDGRLMICCDLQGENCNVWYHYDCVGLTLEEGRRIGASGKDFVCPSCRFIPDDSPDALFIVDTPHFLTPCTDFQWGDISGQTFCNFILSAYEEVVHWRIIVLLVPFGKVGKCFVLELARLYQAFVGDSALHSIALMACSVMQPLSLQKPCKRSKAKDHSHHLSRRLDLWKMGSFDELITECRCIQNHFKSTHPGSDKSRDVARLFDHLLSEGKVGAALRLLTVTHKGGVLPLDSLVPSGSDSSGNPLFKTTKEILQEKHPQGRVATQNYLLDPSSGDPCFDPILFDQLDGCVIRQAAFHTHDAAGPSGVDAFAWQRLCSSFGNASVSLCNALTSVACYLATSGVDPAILAPFVACRLIPLDKNPGIRPIGIGDVPQRILAKAILYCIGDDIAVAAGPLQVCAGQVAGCEAAIHVMRNLYCDDRSEVVHLVDTSNAFNSVNRQAALHNISILCPALSMILHNTYGAPIRLFVTGQGEISSCEGTTQGDPLAMSMYALATVPLIRQLHSTVPDASQVWFADDATAVGTASALLDWWHHLASAGPALDIF